MLRNFRKRHALTIGATSVALVVIGLKIGAHFLGWEVISLNPLFSGIVAANVFLMGFLLSGVLNDFKESERIPGELASILEVFSDEGFFIYERSKSAVALEYLSYTEGFAKSIHDWLYKKERTGSLMDKLSDFNRFFLAFEPLTQVNYIVRLKQEQAALRRIIIRIHTIRETSFISAGYLIAELTTMLLAIGLVFSKLDPWYESFFVVGVVMFLLSYLILLIRDLDNPFGYYESDSAEDVSLRPLEDCIARISRRVKRSRGNDVAKLPRVPDVLRPLTS